MISWNAVAYRRRGFCRVVLDERGRILASSAITCVWSHTPRFDAWFRNRWPIVHIEPLEV